MKLGPNLQKGWLANLRQKSLTNRSSNNFTGQCNYILHGHFKIRREHGYPIGNFGNAMPECLHYLSPS